MKAFSVIFSFLALTSCLFAEVRPFTAPVKEENLALGKPYTVVPAPNYALCLDKGDATQLTDGKYTSSNSGFWTQMSTVGISTLELITFTIDLGKVENIRGFSYNMAAGRAGVEWPKFIRIFTSVDNKEWAYVGDLYAQSKAERGEPKPEEYSVYRAASLNMPSRGRYIAFQVKESPYAFVDELEVYRSSKDESKAFASYEKTTTPAKMDGHILYRTHLLKNIAEIERNLQRAPKAQRGSLPNDLALLRKRTERVTEEDYASLLTTLPVTDFQRKVYQFNSKVLQVNGFTKPVFWHNCRWDNLSPVAMPMQDSRITAPITVNMMRNEVRSEAVNLLNPSENVLKCRLSVKGLPAEARVELRQVIFTDTKQHKGVSGALKPCSGEPLDLEIPAGTSAQVWFTFRKPTLAAGKYTGEIVANYGGTEEAVAPICLNLRNLDFPNEPRLHIGGWDYIQNEKGSYNRMGDYKSHIKTMRSFGADTFWAAVPVMPYGAKFDKEGNLLNPDKLNWTNWDKWMENCPGGRLYCVFVCAEKDYLGEPMGTPRFKKMIAGYYQAWFKGIEARGLKKENIVIHLFDESVFKEQEEIIVTYANAIHAALPDVCIFTDPNHAVPEEGLKEMYEAVDIICPNATTLLSMGKPCRDFYVKQRAAGRKIWLYSCSDPARLLDPIAYYRAIAWSTFALDGEGIMLWAFGCGGGIGDSWHAYAQSATEYSPYFVSPTETMPAKQSEGILEGAEDFEYLSMLKESIARCEKEGKHAEILPEAKKLLASAPVLAVADYDRKGPNPTMPNAIQWASPKDRTKMDGLCIRILNMLEKLK